MLSPDTICILVLTHVQFKMAAISSNDVTTFNDMIFFTATSNVIMMPNLVNIALLTIKLQAFIYSLFIIKSLNFGPVLKRCCFHGYCIFGYGEHILARFS